MNDTEPSDPHERAPRLVVRKQGRLELIAMADVLYVQGADNYVELVLRDGRRELHDSTSQNCRLSCPGISNASTNPTWSG